MDWEELQDAVRALRAERGFTATEAAVAGAHLLQRSLGEMYLGEPRVLRTVVRALVAARPEVVSLRNVGVAVLATAEEAQVGDRMAAAERSARRLARLLAAVPAAVGRRARPLLRGTVVTAGCSMSVQSALLQARDQVGQVVVLQEPERGEDGRLARALSADQVQVATAAPGSQAEVLVESSVVLLGCYALLADGSAVTDAIGAALAREASERGIPVHVMADTLKLAPWLPEGGSPSIALGKVPPEWMVKVVTEDGIRQPRQLQAEAADLAARWRALDEREGEA